MYEPHGWVKSPADENTSIWRYYKSQHFADLIQSSQLHFSRFDQFSDPWEGVLPPETRPLEKDRFTHQPTHPGDTLTDWETYVLWVNRTNKLCGYANCWFESDDESDSMWQLYSPNGVAVKSTFLRIRDSVSGDSTAVHIGELDYLDFRHAQPKTYGNTLAVMFSKRRQFRQEHELRAAVVHGPEVLNCASPQYEKILAKHPTYCKVATDLDVLIERVVLAPGLPTSALESTVLLLANAGLDKPVEPSSLDDRPRYI